MFKSEDKEAPATIAEVQQDVASTTTKVWYGMLWRGMVHACCGCCLYFCLCPCLCSAREVAGGGSELWGGVWGGGAGHV